MKTIVRSVIASLLLPVAAAQAWEPTKPIEIIVPFPPGGASDQMARTIQGAIQKNELVKQPIIIVNKPAAAGGEAMLDIQKSAGDPHKLITTSSGIYMTPLSTKLPVSWKDFTPVAMLAQDVFVLWVNSAKPYNTVKEFLDAAKTATPPLKTGGNGSKREDHLISVTMEQAAGVKITYVPYQGGGPASVQLAGGHIDANMNNPAEEVSNWRSGAVKPLCAFSAKPMEYTQKVTADKAWSDIPTCQSQGLDVTYQMLRGMFMPGKVTPEQQAFYVDLFKKVVETQDWKAYLERNALVPDFRSGQGFVDFLTQDEQKHKDLMTKAGFIATN
ncbi:tripartite tricarboxylate transporter substrate binding protein [Methylorubrum sp. SB2]|uniref:Bug family tripartite tricarboxylate transporter substrate binding protein n=1 Tax=Methylorubrum subtropicum TaxID=3138812 RepID=UPI00313F1007